MAMIGMVCKDFYMHLINLRKKKTSSQTE